MSTLTAHFDLPLNTTSPSWARYAVAAVLGGQSHQGGKRVRAELPLCPGDGVIAGGTDRTEPA